MADVSIATTEQVPEGGRPSAGDTIRALDLDLRIIGMLVALIVIWVGFHLASGGLFITPRNLFNLSVQTSAVGVMATGMVLVIVSRNIDLSVGSLLALVAVTASMLQVEWLGPVLGLEHPALWIIAVIVGLAVGAVAGGIQGWVIAYVGVPSFIVTLGGLLVWRGVAWMLSKGITIAPLDRTYQLLGGGSRGTLGTALSWVVGFVACAGIIFLLVTRRRRRQSYGFPVRPLWADIALGVIVCGFVLLSVAVVNSYAPIDRSLGIANPVMILIAVTLAVNFIATRTRFGRSVFALGGNPEAADLAGINTKRTVLLVFVLMGILVGIGAVIVSARLNAATSSMGQLAELSVIAAAVIGGTSLSGGVGSVPGAVLGALVMQSLVSGMVLIGVDAPMQDVVVGLVLVVAVAIDIWYRKRTEMLTA